MGVKLSYQIDIVRRYLRDPDAKIWSDDYLVDLWNEVQQDFFTKTQVIENIHAIPIPPKFQMSYFFDFETAHLAGDNNYRCLYHQRGEYVCTAPWEAQEYVLISGDAPASGAWPIHPWEAWEGYQVDMLPPIPFPSTYHQTLALYYDEEPLKYCEMKDIQSDDPSWRGRTGEPYCYTRINGLENQFTLYPIPSTLEQAEDYDGETALNVSGDTVSSEYGVVISREGSTLSSDTGAAYEIVDAENNVLIFFRQRPRDATIGAEVEYPEYLCKYIRQGVLAQAYLANTDGKIASLADYWGGRYITGIEATKLFLRKRKGDRNYRLMSQDSGPSRRRRHPRLPDEFPSI